MQTGDPRRQTGARFFFFESKTIQITPSCRISIDSWSACSHLAERVSPVRQPSLHPSSRNSQLSGDILSLCPGAAGASLPVCAHQHTCVLVPIYTCLGINNPQLPPPSAHNRSLCLDLLARQLRRRGHMCASMPLRINRSQRRNTATLCASAGRRYRGGLFLASPVGKNSRVVARDRASAGIACCCSLTY